MKALIDLRFVLVWIVFISVSLPTNAQQYYKEIDQAEFNSENEFEDERRGSIFIGYSQMPFSFGAASIENNSFPAFQVNLPEVNIRHGLNLSTTYYTNENWYVSGNFGYSFSSYQKNRGIDGSGYVGVGLGYELPLNTFPLKSNLAFEVGLAVRGMHRPIERVGDYDISLRATDFVATPTLRYDIPLFNNTSLFFQARYFYDMGLNPLRTRIHINHRFDEFDQNTIRLNNSNVNASPGARLSMENLFEFSVGIRFNF